MKFRSTLALLVIVGAIAAYLYFFERNNPTTREKDENALHVIPDFDRDKVDAISLRSPETKIELRKKPNGAWAMEEPARDRADSAAIHELLTAVETMQSDDPPVPLDPKTTKEQLKEYGISESTTKAKFAGGGKPVELFVGKDTAVEGKTYLYVEGAKSVRVVAGSVKAEFQKKGDDFRDRKLADFGPVQVAKAEIKGPNGTIELSKKDGHWWITKPLEARGDDARISDLLASALNAHVDDFGSDLHLASSGLSEPRGTVIFRQEGVDTPVILNIGQNPREAKDKEKTWARLSSRDALVLVPKSIEKILETTPDDLRDHSLVRVESDIVDRITIEPAGGPKVVVGRTVQSWVGKEGGKDVPINDLAPPRLLSDLQNTQVLEYVPDVATDLSKYGLDQPALKVTFSSFASENTSETKAGDMPIVSVLFGRTEGEKVYAKVDDEPFIVTVSKASMDRIPKTWLELQDLTIFSDKPEEVTALRVTSSVQPTLDLERDKDGKWKLTSGDGKLDQNAITALVITLTRLRAIRWLGPETPEQGLEKAGVVLTATLTKGSEKVTRKLSIGASTGELWAAKAEGKEGVFEIGAPDHDLLVAPLVLDRPAPPKSATPPAAPTGQATPATPAPDTSATPATPAPATPAATPEAPK